MSLSAGLLGAGCGRQLDRQAGLPPGPPSPLPTPLARALRPVLGTASWLTPSRTPPISLHPCHSLSLYLSVFLPFWVSVSPHTWSLSPPAAALSPPLPFLSLCVSLAVPCCFGPPHSSLSHLVSIFSSLPLSLSLSSSSSLVAPFLSPLLCVRVSSLWPWLLSSFPSLSLTPGSDHGNQVLAGDRRKVPPPSPASRLLLGSAGLLCWAVEGPDPAETPGREVP